LENVKVLFKGTVSVPTLERYIRTLTTKVSSKNIKVENIRLIKSYIEDNTLFSKSIIRDKPQNPDIDYYYSAGNETISVIYKKKIYIHTYAIRPDVISLRWYKPTERIYFIGKTSKGFIIETLTAIDNKMLFKNYFEIIYSEII
jgi:hypothetical protein